MKAYITTLAFSFIILFAFSAQAQDLKGPAYKNRKPWKNPKETSTVYMKTGETKQGAGAKILMPFERKNGEYVAIRMETKEKPKGPAYKNQRYGRPADAAATTTEELIVKED